MGQGVVKQLQLWRPLAGALLGPTPALPIEVGDLGPPLEVRWKKGPGLWEGGWAAGGGKWVGTGAW